MRPYAVLPDQSISHRPVISELERGPAGNMFTITFAPGQELPDHRNASRILISVTAGHGELRVAGEAPRALATGTGVQLEPSVVHALTAGAEGMTVEVLLVAACCPNC